MSARVFRDGRVEIVVPRRARADDVARFVSQQREWIERVRDRALRAAPVRPVADLRLPVPQLHLPAVSERWRIEHEQIGLDANSSGARLMEVASTARSAGSVLACDATGVLRLRARAVDQTAMRRLLIDWLRERLRRVAIEQLPLLASSMAADFSAVRIGCQRTRWGSCSRQGTISLNCCVLFQRPEVLRYLLVHELAHRRHMNHSTRFWQHVAAHEPDWRALDRELAQGWRQVPGWIFAGTEVMA
jgi:predicted metal-dependent hydrolase